MSTAPGVESRALAKGLNLQEILRHKGGPASLAELSLLVGLGKASAYRLLQTLVTLGHVRQDEAQNYLATAQVPVPTTEKSETALRAAALPEMRLLNAETAETVSLAVLMGDHVRVVESLESPHHIRLSNPVSRIVPPYASSLGKAITAWQSPERIQELIFVFGIYQITEFTNTDLASIRRDMEAIRERGYSREREESVKGGCCYGAPVFSADGMVRAAVSVAMPLERVTEETDRTIPAQLLAAARRISEKNAGR